MAAIEHEHAVGERRCKLEIVRGDDDGRIAFVANATQLLAERASAHGIQPRRGLVEKEHSATAGENARHRDALRLPAAQVSDRALLCGPRFVEVDGMEPVANVLGCSGSVAGRVTKRELDVPRHVEVVEERAALRNQADAHGCVNVLDRSGKTFTRKPVGIEQRAQRASTCPTQMVPR